MEWIFQHASFCGIFAFAVPSSSRDDFVAMLTRYQGWIDKPQGPILVYFKETQTPSGKRILTSSLYVISPISDSYLILIAATRNT
jgi:hypothetical protein